MWGETKTKIKTPGLKKGEEKRKGEELSFNRPD